MRRRPDQRRGLRPRHGASRSPRARRGGRRRAASSRWIAGRRACASRGTESSTNRPTRWGPPARHRCASSDPIRRCSSPLAQAREWRRGSPRRHRSIRSTRCSAGGSSSRGWWSRPCRAPRADPVRLRPDHDDQHGHGGDHAADDSCRSGEDVAGLGHQPRPPARNPWHVLASLHRDVVLDGHQSVEAFDQVPTLPPGVRLDHHFAAVAADEASGAVGELEQRGCAPQLGSADDVREGDVLGEPVTTRVSPVRWIRDSSPGLASR